MKDGGHVSRHIAKVVGLDPNAKGVQPLQMPIVPGIMVAGKARVDDLILDGNLGKDFLDRWDLTLDLAKGRGWLAPAAENEPDHETKRQTTYQTVRPRSSWFHERT